MSKKESENLEVKAKPPRVTRLNKRTIVFLSGLLLLVIILIMVSALSESTPNKNQVPKSNVKSHKSVVGANKKPINNLPAGYGDAADIDRLLNRNQKPKIVNKIPQAVENQLSALQQSQSQLEAQLAALKNKPASPPPAPSYSAADKQAMTSSIFIAGGAPKPQPQKTASTDNSKSKAADKSGQNQGKQSAWDAQNDQAGKASFLGSKPDKSIYNKNHIQYPASKFILQAGGVIPAILQSTIVSNLPGMITAVVSQNVYDSITGQYLLIPKGSRLIGKYNSKVSYGQDQLQAVFTRLIRPDGTSIVLPGKSNGVNNMGVSGFSDEVNNHWGRIIGSAALITLFNIPSIIATNQQNGSGSYQNVGDGNNAVIYNPSTSSSAKTAALQSLGQAVSKIGSSIASRSLNIQPTITINSGYQFSIMIAKDVILPPYNTPMENIPETGA